MWHWTIRTNATVCPLRGYSGNRGQPGSCRSLEPPVAVFSRTATEGGCVVDGMNSNLIMCGSSYQSSAYLISFQGTTCQGGVTTVKILFCFCGRGSGPKLGLADYGNGTDTKKLPTANLC
jgi:hypothetical protein